MSEFERFEIRALPPFVEAARRLLTEGNVHQIKQDLAANPFVGEPVDEADGMLRYHFDKVDVYYLISADLKRIYLLSVVPDAARSRLDGKRIRQTMETTGKRWIGREIYHRIREFLAESPPWDWF